MIKIIAIGNPLMGDDGIALKVIESIEEDVNQLALGIKFIKAETDFNFALDNIEEGDFLFILDSTLLGLKCGQITQIPFKEVKKYQNNSISVHNMNLLSLIEHFNIKVAGFVLGIEVGTVNFNLGISKEIEASFEEICNKIYKIILVKSLKHLKKGVGSA